MTNPSMEVRHGTLNGYNYHRCRCENCRKAKADYARDKGNNIRVGRRAEQKRACDHKPCPECGRPMRYKAALCVGCREERRAQARHERALLIERWWAEGLSIKQIGEHLGLAPTSAGKVIVELRQEGYVLPYRRRPRASESIARPMTRYPSPYRLVPVMGPPMVRGSSGRGRKPPAVPFPRRRL